MTGPQFHKGEYILIEIGDDRVQGKIKSIAGDFATVETRKFKNLKKKTIHHVRLSALEKINAH